MSQSDFVSRGQTLVASGQFQEAVKVCRLGLLGRPTTVEGRIVLGQALLALKRYDEVLAEMRVALDLDQTSIHAQALKGEALLRKGDIPAALEVLNKAKRFAPKDPQLTLLIAEATRAHGHKPLTSSHPSVGFVGKGAEAEPSESFTKHYPNHGADQEPTGDDESAEFPGQFTRPTSISTPGSKKRSNKVQAMNGASDIPSDDVLAVGDKSGTMEAEMLDDDDDDDFGEVAPPPASGPYDLAIPSVARGAVVKAAPRTLESGVGSRAQKRGRGDVSAVELDSQDMISLDEIDGPQRNLEMPSMTAKGYGPGPGTKVRDAVSLPSGPIDQSPPRAAVRPTAIGPATMPPPLAQQIAHAPHMMQTMSPVHHMPQQSSGLAPPSTPAAMRQTMLAGPAQPPPMSQHHAQSAAAVDALFQGEAAPGQGPAWAHSTVVAGAVDPRIAAMQQKAPPSGPMNAGMFPATATPSAGAMLVGEPGGAKAKRKRSKLAVLLWILIGGAVIGGGVFAGFQIRAMRLHKQIAAARTQAVDLAKGDTWKGWSGARDRLAGIAQASATLDNRAALARARAVLAYEFGDGLADATKSLTRLAGQGGRDLAIAAAYVALAQGEPKAARAAADTALAAAPADAAALYVSGQASALQGDYPKAITELKAAYEKEARPLYSVALARAIAETNAWTDALGAVDRVLAQAPDHPAALIERAFISVNAGLIASGNSTTSELRVMLQKMIAEASEPYATQTRGVSPLQQALAGLALTQINFALRDLKAAQKTFDAAAAVRSDEQRFGEEALDTLYRLNLLEAAEKPALNLRTSWPNSRRGRITHALVMIGRNNPAEALDVLTPDAVTLPRGLAARGQAKLALGDTAGARADFDAALKKAPQLELALTGRAWASLAENDVTAARAIIEPKYNANTSSAAMAVVYAAILRRSSDAAERDRAKTVLEGVIAGAPYLDVGRAHLELGRLYRDLGDMTVARAELTTAAVDGGIFDARMELADALIEDGLASEGKEQLDALLKQNKNGTSPALLLAAARAHMLVGDHVRAAELLEQADKAPNVVRWQADRERGRLAFRKGDTAGASTLLFKALDSSEADRDTLLLATDIANVDLAKQGALADKVKQIVTARFKGTAEEQIVAGKLALAAEKGPEANTAYIAAQTLLGEKASSTRRAQVRFGLAVAAMYNNEEQQMRELLPTVVKEDPTLYSAYLFAANLAEANPKIALVYAEKAVTYNPDNVDGWVLYGQAAAKLNKKDGLAKAIETVTKLAPDSDALAELTKLKR